MKHPRLVFSTLIGVVLLTIFPLTAQAAVSQQLPGATGTAVTPAQCAALRASLGKPLLNCSYVRAYRLSPGTPVSSAQDPAPNSASPVYETGWLEACAAQLCNYGSWAAIDNFGVTFIHDVGVWDNSHSCSQTGTRITWCGAWHNGYSSYMEEGYNFGNNGWARLEIDTFGHVTALGSSYAFLYACLNSPGKC